MKKHSHNHHFRRLIDWFLGLFLKPGILDSDPYCNCIFSFDNNHGGECKQIDFMNGNYKVAGTYGDDVFICKYCYESDKRYIDNWSKGRKDFVNKVQTEDPEFWKASNAIRDRLT